MRSDNKPSNREKWMGFLHWTPRILAIMAILFISLFALDAFQPDLKIGKQIGAFLIHLIPTYILIGVLVLAWKRELLGGALFILLGLAASPWIFQLNYAMSESFRSGIIPVLIIAFPFFMIGILFVWSALTRRHIHSEF